MGKGLISRVHGSQPFAMLGAEGLARPGSCRRACELHRSHPPRLEDEHVGSEVIENIGRAARNRNPDVRRAGLHRRAWWAARAGKGRAGSQGSPFKLA